MWLQLVPGVVSKLIGLCLLLAGVVLAVACLLQLSPVFSNGPLDIAAIFALFGAGFFFLWLGN